MICVVVSNNRVKRLLESPVIYVYFQEKEAKDPLPISQWEAGLSVPAS